MIHKGRDKPHIYKHNGYWHAMKQTNSGTPYWAWKRACEYIRQLNNKIRRNQTK